MSVSRLIFHAGIFILALNLTGCSYLFTKAYGFKRLKPLEEKQITKAALKYNIPLEDLYELNSSSYSEFINSIDTNILPPKHRQNRAQPLQALYYDRNGKLISYQINCYAPGFPNIDWNSDSIMATFPPKEQAPIDTLLNLPTHQTHLQPLSRTIEFSAKEYDFIVILHWNRFAGRQSKRLIEAVKNNSELAGNVKVKILYVNCDNLYVKK